jgi:tRNA(fMet)-specific endonuclease VapC
LLADTTFLIDLLQNQIEAVEKAKRLEEMGIAIEVSSPSIFELYVGISLSKKAQNERSRIISIVESLPQLPLDLESAKAGGAIYGEKLKAGSMIDPEDAMIAGISKVHGESIITRNTKHFSNIDGVKIETY